MTPPQAKIHAFLSSYQAAHSVPPSTRTIQKEMGYGSQTTVVRHLKDMAAKGLVSQLANGSWGIAKSVEAAPTLPVYGAIPAGVPTHEQQESERSIQIDPAIFGISRTRGKKLWALDIKGDSMIGAEIFDGDLGVFEMREAKIGDIVAALVDDTTSTLKRLVQENNVRILRAANPKYADIVPARSLVVQGVLVGTIHRNFP